MQADLGHWVLLWEGSDGGRLQDPGIPGRAAWPSSPETFWGAMRPPGGTRCPQLIKVLRCGAMGTLMYVTILRGSGGACVLTGKGAVHSGACILSGVATLSWT